MEVPVAGVSGGRPSNDDYVLTRLECTARQTHDVLYPAPHTIPSYGLSHPARDDDAHARVRQLANSGLQDQQRMSPRAPHPPHALEVIRPP
jgi:hypothetical protein